MQIFPVHIGDCNLPTRPLCFPTHDFDREGLGKKVLNVNKCFVYNVCVATLVVYPHRASLKNIPGHGGIRTYDLWNACPVWIYTQSSKTYIILT